MIRKAASSQMMQNLLTPVSKSLEKKVVWSQGTDLYPEKWCRDGQPSFHSTFAYCLVLCLANSVSVLNVHLKVFPPPLSCAVLSNGYGSNSPLTPSARISALNIVSDLLRKVGVSLISVPVFLFICQVSGLCTVETQSVSTVKLNHRLLLSRHRLWSQNLLLAETLPRTRKPGRRTVSTTATRSTQTRPTSPSRSTRRISTKRE